TRSASSELLQETEAPSLDEGEALLWALQCVVDAAVAVSKLVEEEFQLGDDQDHDQDGIVPRQLSPGPHLALRELGEAVWGPVLSVLSHVLSHCWDPLVVSMAVEGYESFSVACGVLGLENALDGFFGSLCRFALPSWHGTEVVTGGVHSHGGGLGRPVGGAGGTLGWTHMGTLQAMLRAAHRLGNLLRGSWHVFLDTLEQASTLLDLSPPPAPRSNSPRGELDAVEAHGAELRAALGRFVLYTQGLENEALYTAMSALQGLAIMGMAHSATVLPQERSAANRDRRDKRESSFQQHQGGGGSGPGAVAAAAASGLVSFVGAAARGMGAAIGGPNPGGDSWERDVSDGKERERGRRHGHQSRQGQGHGHRHGESWVSTKVVVECAKANSWRLSVVWELVSGHLRVVAKGRGQSMRNFAVEALKDLVMDALLQKSSDYSPGLASTLGDGDTDPGGGAGPIAGGQEEEEGSPTEDRMAGREETFVWIFKGDVSKVFRHINAISRAQVPEVGAEADFEAVMFDAMELLALTPHVDTREAILQALYSILQSCGHVLDSAWGVILDLLLSVAKGATATATATVNIQHSTSHSSLASFEQGGTSMVMVGGVSHGERNGQGGLMSWGGSCLPLAFKCLKLLVDDFLERVPCAQVPLLVGCAGAFGAQTENVNLSLTAIGMLWTVCDSFALKDETVEIRRGPGNGREEDGGGTRRPSTGRHVKTTTTAVSAAGQSRNAKECADAMWPAMLGQLSRLAVDYRPEV
ncbi:unnamed protein product, partial [Discosporangium mesarthrocarpum]